MYESQFQLDGSWDQVGSDLTTWLGPSERRALPYPVQRVELRCTVMSEVTNGGVICSLIFPIYKHVPIIYSDFR